MKFGDPETLAHVSHLVSNALAGTKTPRAVVGFWHDAEPAREWASTRGQHRQVFLCALRAVRKAQRPVSLEWKQIPGRKGQGVQVPVVRFGLAVLADPTQSIDLCQLLTRRAARHRPYQGDGALFTLARKKVVRAGFIEVLSNRPERVGRHRLGILQD